MTIFRARRGPMTRTHQKQIAKNMDRFTERMTREMGELAPYGRAAELVNARANARKPGRSPIISTGHLRWKRGTRNGRHMPLKSQQSTSQEVDDLENRNESEKFETEMREEMRRLDSLKAHVDAFLKEHHHHETAMQADDLTQSLEACAISEKRRKGVHGEELVDRLRDISLSPEKKRKPAVRKPVDKHHFIYSYSITNKSQ